jgi:hypothetical protein
MKTPLGRMLTALFVGLFALSLAASAHAQQPRPGGRRPIVVPPLPTFNPNYYLPNGQSIGQNAYNLSALGQAYAQVPPYVFGYNPYPPTIVNPYPTYASPLTYPVPSLLNPNYALLGGFANPSLYTNPYFSFFRTFP